MIIGSDLEWGRDGIDVLGLAWNQGLSATATGRTDQTLAEYLGILQRADHVVGQNFLDADCCQLAKEGIDVSWLEPKVYDIRLATHAVFGHLAGTGSYDLRSIVLLLGARQGQRFPLEFKQYESDLHRTCAMDSAAALWCYPTLSRLVAQHHVEPVVAISHQCAPIFAKMREQGVRLDTTVLEQIHASRKVKTERIIERYHLWEERGKKKIKKVPIWRSDKVLDICQQNFGFKPKDRQRKTWEKLLLDPSLTPDAKEFVEAVIDLGKGANDAHWLGKVEESEDGELSFGKVDDKGFIYPRYDLCGSPDRAIASGPNIQNFPRPSDDPREVKLRSAILPLCADHLLIGVDFSAVEMVTNAYESKDTQRVADVLSGRLGHESTAALINTAFGLALTRQQGKACNHAMEKGESPWNLACRLFQTERPSRQQVLQCRAIFDKMLATYPALSLFRDRLWESARNNPLTVTNSFGRRLMCFSRSKYGDADERYAKHDPSKKYWCSCGECAPRRDRFKYAVAFLGRSCAFDILLRKMSTIYYEHRLDEFSLPYLEVHDSLTYSVPRIDADRYLAKAITCFQEPVAELGGISLRCEGAVGENWAQCK